MSAERKSRLKMNRRKFLALAPCAGTGAAIWQWDEVNRLVVERKTLCLPRWKADQFRVALLSDFHSNYRSEGERAARAIRMAIAEKPDAIVLTGDYNDVDTPDSIPSF